FMNLIENFSAADDDIVNICDRANQYMKEPLREIVNDFVMDARLYGNLDAAFDKVIERLNGTKLRDIFQNLKICSRHTTDYGEVIADARSFVKEYLKSKSVQKAVINSARVDFAALAAAGWIILGMLNEFLSRNVFAILCTDFIGAGILLYCAVILLWGIYYLFWGKIE
ncbi:MAG: hypothetical protein NC086_04430, partial [Alistipes sp.]|nr:hypothetical protein [Alistipes sp.]